MGKKMKMSSVFENSYINQLVVCSLPAAIYENTHKTA